MTRRKLGNSILLICLTTLLHAHEKDNVENNETESKTATFKNINTMSTTQLQEELERLSIRGEFSLELGKELIKRWTGKE